MRVCMIGDIVGKGGRQAVMQHLPHVLTHHEVDFTIANGENAAGGKGITPDITEELLSLGIDVITSGNHIWYDRSIINYIDGQERLVRPANYPPGAPGRGWTIARTATDIPVAVINLNGRVNLGDFDCPFRGVDTVLASPTVRDTKVRIVDFHGETTSEKVAFGWYVDGRISAVCGTHTHVQTADYRVLPKGTGYLTDIGMCGSWDSVIGVVTENALFKFTTQMPIRFNIARQNEIFCAVLIDIDEKTGMSRSVRTIWLPERM